MGHEQAFRTDYWLSHCEGFRVDSPRGFVGFVEEVLVDDSHGYPRALVVVSGRSAARRSVVPVGNVAVVQPTRERVSLDSVPAEHLRDEAAVPPTPPILRIVR